MSGATPILTDEMADRVERLLKEWRRTGRAPGGAAQDFARMARELGVGIVDMARHRAWVDERVHEGVLIRCRSAERALADLQGLTLGASE
jgi:hypothetical protein